MNTPTVRLHRIARPLHPGAWWIWALAMASTASRTTNPVLCALVIAVVCFVVTQRRSNESWAAGIRPYLVMALAVIAIRIAFRMFLGGRQGTHVLFTLPEIPLPASGGVRLGGTVALEGILAAAFDGLRLAALLLCVGAANLLANPKRLLKALPSALAEVGTTITVALSFAPQLVESGRRIRHARLLRGDQRSARRRPTQFLHRVALPVLTDALDRSLLLAAAMDTRGYGQRAARQIATRRLSSTFLLAGLVGVCVGTYAVLDGTAPRLLGLPLLTGGLVVAAAGFAVASRGVHRTAYRPDPWRWPEWAVVGCGCGVAVTMSWIAHVDSDLLNPSLQPLRWPTMPLVAVLVILAGALPAWLAPAIDSRGE